MMYQTFMSEENICAQTLVTLVSHGNAIIAELLRLKDHIPYVFCLDSREDQLKYADTIMDFSYFKMSDFQERKINYDTKLQDLDDEIKENNLELISRFYLAFESIYQYAINLNLFLEQLSDGIFIQQTLELTMQDAEGKQLLVFTQFDNIFFGDQCESLYLYGAMLLICDFYIPGVIRERLLVAFYRYSTSQSQCNVDDVCKLLRNTGFLNSTGKKPAYYPHDYFSRVVVDLSFINMVIARLHSEDIYNQVAIQPLPEHRSTALSTQAAMLFVCLFFNSSILMSENTKMREMADKYFPDNWIIAIYMGVTVNVADFWEPFKAAKSAMQNTLNVKNIKTIATKHGGQVPKLIIQTNNILKEGVLTEEKLLGNTSKVINIIRECNVTLRWLLLHTSKPLYSENNKKCKQIKENIIKESKLNLKELLELLINTAQLELKVRDMLNGLLQVKKEKWLAHKTEAAEKLKAISELFADNKPLLNVAKNDQLKLWFENISKQVLTLEENNVTATKTTIQLVQALEEVEEFHGLRSTVGLNDARQSLRNALRISALREESLVTLEIVADVSYAWCLIENFTVLMQDSIRDNPSITGRLRALFLKLASAMEIPLLRINQCHSEDLESVSHYYSNELVNYVRKVLQIIPEMVFSILEKIITLQTWSIKEVPTRLERERLREFAQLEDRMKVAKLTHSASVFTKGILMMRTTLVGVVRIDPAVLLEEGLRKELARNVIKQFEVLLDTNSKSKPQPEARDLLKTLHMLADSMDGYKRSLEYIQDYINIHGLQMWQEEVSDIINASVRKEITSRRGVVVHSPTAGFMGQLARDILRLTDTRSSVYIDVSAAWYDNKTHKEIVNVKTFSKVKDALGPIGLHGLDSLYSFMIVGQLRELTEGICSVSDKDTSWLETMNHFENDKTNLQKLKLYMQSVCKGSRIWSQMCDCVLLVGSLQTLRRHIGYHLNTQCKFDSNNLDASLHTFNKALLNDVRKYIKDDTNPKPSAGLVHTLGKYLVRAGSYEPQYKIYTGTLAQNTRDTMWHTRPGVWMCLLVVSQLNKLQFFASSGDIISRKPGENIDGHPLTVGIYTLLKQYETDALTHFIQLLCYYVMNLINVTLNSKNPEFPQEAQTCIKFLEYFCYINKIPFKMVEDIIPLNIVTYE